VAHCICKIRFGRFDYQPEIWGLEWEDQIWTNKIKCLKLDNQIWQTAFRRLEPEIPFETSDLSH
jgi:hypothetical protein